jgi:hypothetical protein
VVSSSSSLDDAEEEEPEALSLSLLEFESDWNSSESLSAGVLLSTFFSSSGYGYVFVSGYSD